MEKYCCSWYGSNIWSLQSPAVESLCAAWRTAVKLAWNVDRACHGYFVSSVLAPGFRPIKACLLSRFHNFFLTMLDSPSHECQLMARLSARDIRSSFGSNLNLIRERTNLDPWEASNHTIKNKLSLAEASDVPSADEWRVDLLSKLLGARLEAYYGNNRSEEARLSDLIRSLTIF